MLKYCGIFSRWLELTDENKEGHSSSLYTWYLTSYQKVASSIPVRDSKTFSELDEHPLLKSIKYLKVKSYRTVLSPDSFRILYNYPCINNTKYCIYNTNTCVIFSCCDSNQDLVVIEIKISAMQKNAWELTVNCKPRLVPENNHIMTTACMFSTYPNIIHS